MHNRFAKLICIDIEKFEKKFAYDFDYKKNICNSYQAD